MPIAQFAFGARGDSFHSANQPFAGLVGAPVARNQGPHYDAQIELARNAREPWIAHSKWGTKPLRRRAGCITDRVAASPHLVPNLRLAKPKKIRVRFRVIPEGVPANEDFFHQLRTLLHEPADQEKCRPSAVAIEKIQQLWRDGRIRSVIKRNRKAARRIRAANRRSKQLRPRKHRPVRRDSRSRPKSACCIDEPKIHRIYFGTELCTSPTCSQAIMRVPSRVRSLGFAESLQVDSKLLALLVQVTALESQRLCDIRHVKVVPLDFRQQHFSFVRFGSFGERSGAAVRSPSQRPILPRG